MSGWVQSLLERTEGVQVVRRARHALHVRGPEGQERAYITGAPMHYHDGGRWLPIDTALREGHDGRYGAPFTGITLASDGTVRVRGSGYAHRAERVGLYHPVTGRFRPLATLTSSRLEGGRLVADAGPWRYEQALTERGLREELHLDERPDLPADSVEWLAVEARVSGELPEGMAAGRAVAWDAGGVAVPAQQCYHDGRLYTGVPVAWLEGAQYPVTVDPDFYTYGAGYDLWLDYNNPDQNHNVDNQLPIYTYTWASVFDRAFPLMRFDLSSMAGTTLESGTLTVYGTGAGLSPVGEVYVTRILPANLWTPAATWNYADGSSLRWAGDVDQDGGQDAGCRTVGVDISATPLATPVISGAKDVQTVIDLDPAELNLMNAQNAGLKLYRNVSSVWTLYLHSGNATDPALRPVLTLDEAPPGIPDLWPLPVAEPAAMLEIMWDDAWVDETDYLLMDGGADVKRALVDPLRGLANMGQAPLGTATIRVRNDDGRYSVSRAGSMAATYGLYGKPIRFSLGYKPPWGPAALAAVFTGRIVDPQGTEAGETVTLACRDEGETLLRQTASRQMNEGAQSSSLIATFANEAGLEVTDYVLDQGLFLVPFAYLQEDNLWGEVQRVAASEGGMAFIDRHGRLRFWNAAHFDTLTSVAAIDESLYGEATLRYDYENAYSVVTVSFEPRQRSETVSAFSLRRPVVVPAGGTAREMFEFRWPLAQYDHYEVTAVSGGGADLSADVSVTAAQPQYAQSWEVEFGNANAVHAAYITGFEVIGRVAEARAAETYTVDPQGLAGTKAAKKASVSGNFYLQTPGQARVVGNLLGDRMQAPLLTLHLSQCPALPTLELGDRITVQAGNHQLNRAAIITGLRWTFGPAAKMDIDCLDASALYGESGYFVVGTSALGTGKLFY